MNPLELKVKELERKILILESAMRSLTNPAQIDPLIPKAIASAIKLGDLSDITFTSPSNGQVVEYLNGTWINATDNT